MSFKVYHVSFSSFKNKLNFHQSFSSGINYFYSPRSQWLSPLLKIIFLAFFFFSSSSLQALSPWTFCDFMDYTPPGSSGSMEFSRQEYWSRLPFPPPRDRVDRGTNLCYLHLLPWQADSLPLCHLGSFSSLTCFRNGLVLAFFDIWFFWLFP